MGAGEEDDKATTQPAGPLTPAKQSEGRKNKGQVCEDKLPRHVNVVDF